MTNDKYLEMIRDNWRNLGLIENQTPELCMAAVKQNGYALECVKEQTPEL